MSVPPASRSLPSPVSAETPAAGAILAELESLAVRTEQSGERCGMLFERLRKARGTARMSALMAGMEVHLRRGGPVAARLLAAYLEVDTQAGRLLPRLRHFGSSRRYLLRLYTDRRGANAFARDWVARLTAAAEALPRQAEPGKDEVTRPGQEYPWPQVRRWLDDSLETLRRPGGEESGLSAPVAQWLRLEVDALEERASSLAGSVNPFRIATVQRALPLLNGLDAVIRDGRRWLADLESGHLDRALRIPSSAACGRMEENEFRALQREIEDSGAERLGALLRRRIDSARPGPELADDILRLQMLSQALGRDGATGPWNDLLSAAEAAVTARETADLQLAIEPELCERIGALLGCSFGTVPEMAGVDLDPDSHQLVLPRRTQPARPASWPHGLPVVRDGRLDDVQLAKPASATRDAEVEEGGAAATRRLVVSSMQTMSILVALLRNPKVTSIPGLVAEVATRTRNPQVIATIATDRALYTGFANRDVPLACLWNPSNVSVKVLRKFIHVKYVSKLDLVRLSQDRAGVRRELRQEIDRYLETLA